MAETMPTAATAAGGAVVSAPTADRPLDLSGARSRNASERVIGFALFLCGALSVLTTIGIVGVLIFETVEFFRLVSFWDYITGTEWRPNRNVERGDWGVLPLVSATLTYALIAMLIAIPIGLMTAIYLSEYAPQNVRSVVKPILELLAGVPTIVYGFFALTFITPEILKRLESTIGPFNVLAAGLAIGALTIPLVASLSEDALRAVPRALREGAYALGATKLETSIRIVFPAAISGVVASVLLALGRAVGETMIIVVAAGSRPADVIPNPLGQLQAMTSYIVLTLSGDAPRGTTEYRTLFAVGLTLFAMTLLLNIVSQWLVARYREVYQ